MKHVFRSRAAAEFVADLRPESLIGGRRVPAGSTIAALSPSTGAHIADIGDSGEEGAEQAMAAARGALASRAWRGAPPLARAALLNRLAQLIEDEADVIAELEALDGVRPFHEARLGDVPGAAGAVRFFAGLAPAIEGAVLYPSFGYLPPSERVRITVEREPVGVVVAITPWNVPFFMAAAKVAQAVAAGCTVVLKPSEEASLTALYLGAACERAGFPSGVVNVVTGRGGTVGAALVRHPDTALITFTGSTRTGVEIGGVAGSLLKPVSLELGGKSPVIIAADADLDRAVPGAASSIFSNSGQICVAGSRLYAHRSVFDAVMEGLTARAGALSPAGTFDEAGGIGPLISTGHAERVDGYVAEARAAGAEVRAGGGPSDFGATFYQPTVLTGLAAGSRMLREEVFGPVIACEPYDELDEALELANASEYGLSAAIWTRDVAVAQRAADAFDAGVVYINCQSYADPSMPIQGRKRSGLGGEMGREGLAKFLKSKSVCTAF